MLAPMKTLMLYNHDNKVDDLLFILARMFEICSSDDDDDDAVKI